MTALAAGTSAQVAAKTPPVSKSALVAETSVLAVGRSALAAETSVPVETTALAAGTSAQVAAKTPPVSKSALADGTSALHSKTVQAAVKNVLVSKNA